MFFVSPCAADDRALCSLVDAMTAELIPVYGLASDARPTPLSPEARYLLVRRNDQAVGCCAVQPITLETCELKRMFVSPAVRGEGAAGALLTAAEQLARELGGRWMRLETGVRQPAAIRLYERSGYRMIANYPPHEQDPLSVCYEKSLTAAAEASDGQ
ncbi:GNAT family N-acetyltransferase [Kitasatospora sp. CM 4170]|uniref:GNAT family N-acetyltransferase n=1 Tax=Kitasatospora aburaviensis TaxID=67265 RepID=A0ABW1F5V3_9ACTN|nr:GNAT family N-acetyltransferase [Kitasatospora sp. CM 4170]WNM43401.1 GNAT family N-acetyltransferase [Kitasatospora sp. CM 4170]